MRGAGHVGAGYQHLAARLLQAQLLLVLQRAHRRHGLEVVVERRHAHVHRARHVFHAQRLRVVGAQRADGFRDALRVAVVQRDLAQPRALAVHQQAVHDLALDERRHDRNVFGRVEQPQQAQHGLQHRHGDAVDVHAARGRRVGLGRQLLVADEVADLVERQLQPHAQVGLVLAGHAHLAAHRQVDRGDEVVHGVVHVDVVAHDDPFGALRNEAQRRRREAVLGAVGLADAVHLQAGHGAFDRAVLPARDVADELHQLFAGGIEFGFQRHRHGEDGGGVGGFVGHGWASDKGTRPRSRPWRIGLPAA
ncbi:hypothetical protein FQZ97_868630 [compost metagenome]